MKEVTWKDMQYGRDRQFYAQLRGVLEDLGRKYKAFSEKTQQHEREFFKHLNHSVKIDRLPTVSRLLAQLRDRLNTRPEIDVFLFQHPISNALCIPRYGVGRMNRLVILVSQHFLNDLSADEQLSVLGHEIAHLLFGHVEIPARAILESEFSLKDTQGLKSDVLKWLTCAEISCDIVGYLGCNRNADAFCVGLLKYATGLTASTIEADGQDSGLIALMLEQFEDISKASFDTTLTTHPLTPLRLRIVTAVSESPLVKHFGKPLSEQTLDAYQSEYNRVIDAEVRKIYPRMIPTEHAQSDDVIFDLCVAVAAADGRISKGEVSGIARILGEPTNVDETYAKIKSRIARASVSSFASDAIRRAVAETERRGCSKADILSVLKSLLVVAGSDGKIETSELDVIYNFAKVFGVSKQDILFLIERGGLR